jgi:trehalose synthase
MRLEHVRVNSRPLDHFEQLVRGEALDQAKTVAEAVRQHFAGRVIWHVNSTAIGGGVAEMLRPQLAYVRGTGVDTRWVVISGSPEFFRITKRLHHALHGVPTSGFDEVDRVIYEDTLRENAVELCATVRPRDVVFLHDPQTAGLAPYMLRAGAAVVWRCHIGCDEPERASEGWEFLSPYLRDIPVAVFSREAYVPELFDRERAMIIQPSIDAFSPKNQELDEESVHSILVHVGLVEGPPPAGGRPDGFLRADGSPGRIEHRADLIRMGRAPLLETPLVVQVSRWDPLKDPVGVMQGFARFVDGGMPERAELVLAGPNVHAVVDDPEGDIVFRESLDAWRDLPHQVRDRITLACLPTHDVDENAAIVNALQRHATVIVQKSLKEGFGLTVTEGMWKGKPLVASRVGGIQDQIEDGETGLLLGDSHDLNALGEALTRVLGDPALAKRLGEAARESVRERFLGLRQLTQYASLLLELDQRMAGSRVP